MELPDDVVELVRDTLEQTVNGVTTSDAEVQALMDLQERALEELNAVIGAGSPGATGH